MARVNDAPHHPWRMVRSAPLFTVPSTAATRELYIRATLGQVSALPCRRPGRFRKILPLFVLEGLATPRSTCPVGRRWTLDNHPPPCSVPLPYPGSQPIPAPIHARPGPPAPCCPVDQVSKSRAPGTIFQPGPVPSACLDAALHDGSCVPVRADGAHGPSCRRGPGDGPPMFTATVWPSTACTSTVSPA